MSEDKIQKVHTDVVDGDETEEDEVPQQVQQEEEYEVDEKVLVFFGELLFDAVVLDIDQEEDADPFHVHFLGWHKRNDMWVPLSHMNKLTEDNQKYQKDLQEIEKQALEKKKQQAKDVKRKRAKEEKPKEPKKAKKASKAKATKSKSKKAKK